MKKIFSIILTLSLVFSLTGCFNKNKNTGEVESPAPSKAETVEQESSSQPQQIIRVAALKGPTGMGLAALMAQNENNTSNLKYEFTLCASPEEIAPLLLQKQVDFASLPANLSANLFNRIGKEEKEQISAVAINTVGNLTLLTKGEEIESVSDLKGKTVLSSGKGASPEAMLNFLLSQSRLDPSKDLEVIYKTEHTECLSALLQQEKGIALLPQPFATTAIMKDESLKIAFDFNEEWKKSTNGDIPITGVLVGRNEFLESYKAETQDFLNEYEASAKLAQSVDEEAVSAIEKFNIAPSAVAKKALPLCGIEFITGEDMKKQLSAYLSVLNDFNPKLLGGNLPTDSFYYLK